MNELRGDFGRLAFSVWHVIRLQHSHNRVVSRYRSSLSAFDSFLSHPGSLQTPHERGTDPPFPSLPSPPAPLPPFPTIPCRYAVPCSVLHTTSSTLSHPPLSLPTTLTRASFKTTFHFLHDPLAPLLSPQHTSSRPSPRFIFYPDLSLRFHPFRTLRARLQNPRRRHARRLLPSLLSRRLARLS